MAANGFPAGEREGESKKRRRRITEPQAMSFCSFIKREKGLVI
jgi:hypothetical protein